MKWLLFVCPAALSLAWVWLWSVGAPEPPWVMASWHLRPVPLLPSNWADCGDGPYLLGFRLLYLGLLYSPAGDFGRGALFTWLIACASCVVIARRASRTGAITAAAAAALIGWTWLSPVYGADWLLNARFRFVLPAAALLIVTGLLVGRGSWRWRYAASAAVAQLAIFIDPAGVLVWLAAVPLVWSEAHRRNTRQPGVAIATWCLLGSVGTMLCGAAAVPGKSVGLFGHLAADPLAGTALVAHVAGLSLPDLLPGARADGVVVGAALLLALGLALLATARRRGAGALPWLCLALFGFGNAVLLCHYHGADVSDEVLREGSWATVMLPLGIAGVAAVLRPDAVRGALRWTVPLLALALALDWYRGVPHLASEAAFLRQGAARLVFQPAATDELNLNLPQPISEPADVAQLRARGRLRRCQPVATLDLAELAAADPAPGALRFIDTARAVGTLSRGAVWPAPDLVLLTRASSGSAERIFKIVEPAILVAGDEIIWSTDFTTGHAFADGETVHGYAFDLADRTVAPLAGVYVFREGAFVPEPEGER